MTRFDNICNIAAADLSERDKWGSAMVLFFDVAEVLHAFREDAYHEGIDEAFNRWQYQHSPIIGPCLDEMAEAFNEHYSENESNDDVGYGVAALAWALRYGQQISVDDLLYAGEVLHKYTVILRANGHDY